MELFDSAIVCPSNVKFDCAIALVVDDPFAVNTRFVAGLEIAENPGPVDPVTP
jgi:hypothetical protein